jgi:hypothetical protein
MKVLLRRRIATVLNLNSDIGFPNYANLFGLQCLERNKSDFDEVGLRMDRLLIPQRERNFRIPQLRN